MIDEVDLVSGMNARNQRNSGKSGFQKRDERQKPEELLQKWFSKAG